MKSVDDNLNYHSAGATVFDDRLRDQRFSEYRRQWRENPANDIVSGFPLHLDIESTNACNLRCPHCAATSKHWGSGKIGFMDFELFKKIIDEAAANGCCCVKFSLRGEPLLHKQLPEMVRTVIDAGIIDAYFNTNGMLLTEKRIHSLLEAELPRISISVDGWDKDSFNSFRVGADYDTICRNIELLLSIRGSSETPRLRVQTVMLPEMRAHWREYQEHWRGIADEVGYLDYRDEGPRFDHTGQIDTSFRCPFLWQRMTILWDGTLLPCLMHGVGDFSLMSFGNVKDISIRDAWHSAQERHYRELHQSGRSHEIAACDQCSYRAMEINKLSTNRTN